MSWITDGSSQLTVNGGVVTCTGGSGNTYNAIWNEPITGSGAYWQFKFSNLVGGAFVGVCNQGKFQPGYKIRGAFYGGNLADGCGLLVSEFGPRFENNDIVGMLVSKSGGNLEVSFEHNGNPLGIAYRFPEADLPNALPTVLFHESGSVSCVHGQMNNIIRSRSSATSEGPAGSWILSTMTGLATPSHPTLELTKKSDTEFQGVAKVINNIRFTVTQNGASLSAAGGAMTMMAGDETMMAFENGMVRHFLAPTTFSEANGVLTYNSAEYQSTWARHDNTPGAFQGSPFRN